MYPQINENPDNVENPNLKTFKILQRENSVNKYYVELKEDVVLTEKGFFDLAKVPGLRVVGAGQFLKKIRRKTRLRQKDIAKLLGVNHSNMKEWEINRNRMPLQSLVKVAETLGVSRDTIYLLIDQGILSLKRSKNLLLNFEKIRDIVKYFIPQKYDDAKGRITLLKGCPDETRSKIEEILNMKPKSYAYHKQIRCSELYNFLTTFFRYRKVSKIHPPLVRDVKQWFDNNIDLKCAVIIPCLQSDGTVDQGIRHYRLAFSGLNKVLHNYFVDAMYYQYNELPTSYFIPNNPTNPTVYETRYEIRSKNEILDEIMTLAGNTKTSPANGQTVADYLNEPQPHLNYLTNTSETEQIIALRIWASTEGYVSIVKRSRLNKESLIPTLGVSCAHPVLAKQLQQIAKRLRFPLYIKPSKNSWSGLLKLENKTICGCIKFLEFGGFIKGVKISAKSKYHKGIDKDILTLGILEYIRQRKTTKRWPRKLPIDVHHHNINKIIKKGEYKSADYYTVHFS